MEFLDPAAKKARTIRLFIGYVLLAIVVALATTILVYQAQGFGYDRDKGVTRSGLLFLDANPVSANITLDGKFAGDKTNARLTLPEGTHTIKLSADKYRDWTKQFAIDGGDVKYMLYPRLFPKDIPLGITRVLPVSPAWSSQSPDKHWLVYQQASDSLLLSITDILKPAENPITSTLPVTALSSENGLNGTIKPIEWADDNKHLLLLQTLPSGARNYILFDRENADQSINITKALSLTVDQELSLRDKKSDKFYAFSATKGEIRNASLKTGDVSEPFVTGVVAFKSHGDNIIFYATYDGAKVNQTNLITLTDQKNKYNLRPIDRDPNNKYLLNLAKFDSTWIYTAGSPSSELMRIYRDPLSRVKANSTTQASPQVSMRIKDPQFASFSDNSRFVAVQSGKQFVVYDAEDGRLYRYEMQLSIDVSQQAKWMDGHRLTVNSDGRVFAFDFDGTNAQNLVTGMLEFNAYFDKDYKFLYTFVLEPEGKVGFQNAKLIL